MKIHQSFLLSVVFLFCSALSAQTTLLNDVFNSTSSSGAALTSTSTSGAGTQSLPTSSTWFLSAAAGASMTYTNGSPAGTLAVTNPTSVVALTYFTPAGSPQQLSPGDALTIAFNFSVAGIPGGTPGSAFRLGVFNSGSAGNQIARCIGLTNAFFNTAYAGFGVFVNPNPGQGAETLQQRVSGNGSTLLTTTGTIWTQIANQGSTTPGLTNGTPYQGVLTLVLASAGTMNVSFQINSGGTPVTGYTVSGSSSSAIPTAFDTFAMGASTSSMTSYTFTNVAVTFIPQAAVPTFTPAAGTYITAQSVSISSVVTGLSFAYTTDGSTPTEIGGIVTNGTLYAAPIAVSANTTLKAISFTTGTGGNDSAVATAAYIINLNGISAPVFSPAAGTYTSTQSVSITSISSGASIAYTTDGSTPTESGAVVTHGTLYSGPVSIATTSTLRAIAFKATFTDSSVTSGTYTISAAAAPTTPDTPTSPLPYTGPGGGAFDDWFLALLALAGLLRWRQTRG